MFLTLAATAKGGQKEASEINREEEQRKKGYNRSDTCEQYI